jgi:hypothetical protein
MPAMKWLIGAAMLASSAGALADNATGTYMTFNRAMSESPLPDGSFARVIHYYQAGTSDNAANPFAGKGSECVARMIVSSAGKVTAGTGFCFMQDAAGNGGAWTWAVTEAGTARCPSMCGTFKWAEGYGSTRQANGSGEWKQTFASAEGGAGTYTVTYTP